MAKSDRLAKIAKRVVQVARPGHNVVAIVEKSGRILSIGINDMRKSHPCYWNGEHDRGVHAEYDALRQVKFTDLSNASLYIFRFKKSGSLGLARPCDDCTTEIEESGIGKVYYSTDRGEIKRHE